MSQKYIDYLLSLPLKGQLKKCLKIYTDNWLALHRQINDLTKDLDAQNQRNERAHKILQTVPGLGIIGESTFTTELCDVVSRFSSQKKLYSYLGLTPSEHSSGDSTRRGHITRKGPPRLRRILTEMAWVAIKSDEALQESFQRIAARRGKKIAIVAIARKLAGKIRACLRSNFQYVPATY